MYPLNSKKETQSFPDAEGFWRICIPDYSLIVSLLCQVTQKKNDFVWGSEQQQTFDQINRK